MKKLFASMGALGAIPYFFTLFTIVLVICLPLWFVIEMFVFPLAGVLTAIVLGLSAWRYNRRHEAFKYFYRHRKEIKSLATLRGEEYAKEQYDIPEWAWRKLQKINY